MPELYGWRKLLLKFSLPSGQQNLEVGRLYTERWQADNTSHTSLYLKCWLLLLCCCMKTHRSPAYVTDLADFVAGLSMTSWLWSGRCRTQRNQIVTPNWKQRSEDGNNCYYGSRRGHTKTPQNHQTISNILLGVPMVGTCWNKLLFSLTQTGQPQFVHCLFLMFLCFVP